MAPGFAYHVTQRGHRRQPTFFRKDDYRAYLELMVQWWNQRINEVILLFEEVFHPTPVRPECPFQSRRSNRVT